MDETLENLQYPIGRFQYPGAYNEENRQQLIATIRELPGKMRALTESLSKDQLELPYRPGGWTIQQVVHHVADSHLNSIIRFKLGLTENTPTIKPYDEGAWAKLRDTEVTPIAVSVQLLEALHLRWVNLLDGFAESDWQRKVYHPESKAKITLDEFLGSYAWHGEHHLAHIRLALDIK